MKSLLLFLALSSVLGCDKQSSTAANKIRVSVETPLELSPKDLGIEKHRFHAFPQSDEVAIFRSKYRSRINPLQRQTYDQIFWTNKGQVAEDIVITPLSFYLGYPEPQNNSPEQQFRDSWRLRAGGFGYDINEFTFLQSNWTSSDERSTGKVVYTKDCVAKPEDLVFEFEMFVLPISEAKRIHPQLEVEREKGTGSWKAAFVVAGDADK